MMDSLKKESIMTKRRNTKQKITHIRGASSMEKRTNKGFWYKKKGIIKIIK